MDPENELWGGELTREIGQWVLRQCWSDQKKWVPLNNFVNASTAS